MVRSFEILIGTNCAPHHLFLYSYGSDFLDNMIRCGHRKPARSFNLCFQHIDDLIAFNNNKLVKGIYLYEFNIEKTNQSDNIASYLDYLFTIEKGYETFNNLFDKLDDFDFHIDNFK